MDAVLRTGLRAVTSLIPRRDDLPAEAIPDCLAEASRLGFAAAAAFPLRVAGRLHGILSLYAGAPGGFREEGLRILDEMAGDLSFAMELVEGDAGRDRAVRALRESEGRHGDLVRMSPEAIFVSRNDRIVFANRATLELFGAHGQEELLGKSLFDVIHADSHPGAARRTESMKTGEPPHLQREKIVRFDGSVRDVEMAAAPFTDHAGSAIQVVLHDITERERTERALVESENRLKKAQAMAHVGNWEINLKKKEIWGSEEARRIYGLDDSVSTRELSAVQALVLPEYRPQMDRAVRALVAGTDAYDVEFAIRRASDGAVRYLHSRAERVADVAGNPGLVVGVVQDITERKRAEEALRESEQRIKTTLYSIGDGVIATDVAGAVAQMNRAAETMTGWAEADARGRTAAEVFRLVDEDTGALRPNPGLRAIQEGIAVITGSGAALEARDGTRRQVSCSAAPILDARGGAAGAVLVFADKTKERELEAQVRQAQKLEAVGRLAGGIAHDFNNALAVILGYAQLMEEDLRPTDPMQSSVRAIADAARRSAGLTRQLLAFARKQIVAPVPLDLNASIASLEKMLQRLIGEDITLVLRPAAGLWVTRIDPTQVDQILANLSTNARDAIRDTGTITLETSNVTVGKGGHDRLEAAPGEYVCIAFSDTGRGMDRATRARIFEPFFTTKPAGEGTGLGLATVFGIVKQNGGFIGVSSEPGRGTTIRILLPRFRGVAQAPAEAGQETPPRGSGTVLLVEDEAQLLLLARMILESSGYTVLAAASPGDAILLCKGYGGSIDLLITDVVMPGMNGRELQERLAALRPGMKALYMSGYTADVIAHRGIVDEGSAFIAKPFTPQAFTLKVREVLSPPIPG